MQKISLIKAGSAIVRSLRLCGINPTAQRICIAELLLEAPQHLSADQILVKLRSQRSTISKATVYNTLNLLASKGVIRQLVVDGDRKWFDSNIVPHFHFFDTETGELTDISTSSVQFECLPDPPSGMEYAGIELYIRLRHV